MSEDHLEPLSADELAAEAGTALPPKEVISLLDLNVDLDLALDVAAPIDLAVAANANVAAPINAAVGANVLSAGSTAQSLADQGVNIDQGLSGHAIANAPQDSSIDQTGAGSTTPADGTTTPTDGTTTPTDGTTTPTDGSTATDGSVSSGNLLDGNLLNVDVNLDGKLNLAAPIDGAVAANANAAAPIDASVSANIGSPGAVSVAVANQEALIDQSITGDASATADQVSAIEQGPADGSTAG
jgi:hypothetical protein